MRIYLPATLELLARWHAAGAVEGVQEGYEPSSDSEDDEYAALMAAAGDAAALLTDGGRRVVVVVDTEDPDARSVPLRRVVAVHADELDRPAGADPADDLCWYATQEIPDLLT